MNGEEVFPHETRPYPSLRLLQTQIFNSLGSLIEFIAFKRICWLISDEFSEVLFSLPQKFLRSPVYQIESSEETGNS